MKMHIRAAVSIVAASSVLLCACERDDAHGEHDAHAHTAAAASHEAPVVRRGDLRVGGAIVPLPPPGGATAAAYLTVENVGAQAIRLVRATSPAVKSISLHETTMNDGIARMRPVDGFVVAPGSTLEIHHERHLMLEGWTQPLARGQQLPITLTFEPGGSVEVSFAVQ